MFIQPQNVYFSLPVWLAEYVKDCSYIKDVEGRMHFVIEAARKNVTENTGGTFRRSRFRS